MHLTSFSPLVTCRPAGHLEVLLLITIGPIPQHYSSHTVALPRFLMRRSGIPHSSQSYKGQFVACRLSFASRVRTFPLFTVKIPKMDSPAYAIETRRSFPGIVPGH